MGLIGNLFTLIFGGGRNVVRETAEVFVENAEAGAVRAATAQSQALAQHGAEFAPRKKGNFDRFMDGLNRVPRPALALGTLALFVAAMVDPVWFAARMQGLILVPEPLWWLLGAIVSFYFGARHQVKGQEFQRSLAQTVARVPEVVSNLRALRALSPGVARTGADARLSVSAISGDENAALEDWRKAAG
ncbi:holin family protein [Aliiroseovarius sp. YM-037]|uniref:holin family protein n=1 Tax=Aliiroseovarius sp. YM-037 TaxID=3341728 RepID=UPI003A7FE1DC